MLSKWCISAANEKVNEQASLGLQARKLKVSVSQL